MPLYVAQEPWAIAVATRWRHDVGLAGKKVAVIGSAASAVQIVPLIAESTAQVILFQRTANYLVPRHDREYRAIEKWCFRYLPFCGKIYRLALFLRYEWLAYPIVKTSAYNIQRRWAMRQFRSLLRKSVPDAALRDKLTPDYPIGCKRILISDEYWSSFERPNVELVTDPIEEIKSTGIQCPWRA